MRARLGENSPIKVAVALFIDAVDGLELGFLSQRIVYAI
jgi:hypothetical protein